MASGRGARLVGIAFKNAWVVGNCTCNVVNALVTRHLAPFKKMYTYSGDHFIYTTVVAQQLADLFWQAYEPGSWKTNKSQVRIAAIQDSLDFDHPRPQRILGHIKTEVCPTRPSKARLIQAFHKPADNYGHADAYRAFTHALTQWTAIPRSFRSSMFHLRSACGLNHGQMAEQITEWLRVFQTDRLRLLVDDLSNMDGSVQVPLLEKQTWLYRHFDPGMAMHHARTIHFSGLVRGRSGNIRYKGHGTVKSGAQDTSSGQTCRRIDSLAIVLERLGVLRAAGFVFGDDVLVFVDRDLDGGAYEQAQAEHGFSTKFAVVDALERADFLSCTFMPDRDGSYAMLPKPGRLLAKLFWTWRAVPEARRGAYVREVAIAFDGRFSGCTFLERWLGWHRDHPIRRGYKMPWQPAQPVHPSPIDWPTFFACRYSLPMPPEDLIAHLDVPYGQTALISHWWTDAVQEYDLADPSERVLFS